MEDIIKLHMESVVVLGVEPPEEVQAKGVPEFLEVGTGFFYSYPWEGDLPDDLSELPVWLVTCRHVVKEAQKYRSSDMVVRHNREGHPDTATFVLPELGSDSDGWLLHPRADIAVMRAPLHLLMERGLECTPFLSGEALTKERISKLGLGEGDDVYTIGFPEGWELGYRDYPIIRQGIIAQIRGWMEGAHDHFLVDGSAFGGNSGGPVVTRPQSAAASDDPHGHSFLLGMVTASKMIRTADDARENADLIEVLPMDYINEIIDSNP